MQRYRLWWQVGGKCITTEAPDVGICGSKFSGQACDGFGEGTDGVSIKCGCGS